jgi:hypothetical protein
MLADLVLNLLGKHRFQAMTNERRGGMVSSFGFQVLEQRFLNLKTETL